MPYGPVAPMSAGKSLVANCWLHAGVASSMASGLPHASKAELKLPLSVRPNFRCRTTLGVEVPRVTVTWDGLPSSQRDSFHVAPPAVV